MAVMRDLSAAQLALQIAGEPLDLLDVVRYSGSEGLCQLYRFEVDVSTKARDFTLARAVGKAAVLSINTAFGERWFHGVICRCEFAGGSDAGEYYFRIELAPTAWLLTQRYNSRIYQNKDMKEIVADVLTKGGVPADRVTWRTTRTFVKREYCVQYRETDYNFIARLMEHEGVFWYFEHYQDKHMLVLDDGMEDFRPIVGEAKLSFIPPSGQIAKDEHVYRFRRAQAVRPDNVALMDFDWKNPKKPMDAGTLGAGSETLQFYDFPGEYVDQNDGQFIAGLRFEELNASRDVGVGQSNSNRLAPARVFELTQHSNPACNGKYFITTVTHSGRQAITRSTTTISGHSSVLPHAMMQSLLAARGSNDPMMRNVADGVLQLANSLRSGDPTARRALTEWLYHAGQVVRDLPTAAAAAGGSPLDWLSIPNLIGDVAAEKLIDYDMPTYECRFECRPQGRRFRPPRVTPWPDMRGTQTARVVGPQGEEIHTDEYGRIRVQFHWDRQGSENGQPKLHGADSSCWIRVTHALAGGGYGVMFIPRVGQEVVIDFLEGNPDKPICIGCVYNGDHMPPYELPANKTRTVIKSRSTVGGGGCNEIRIEDRKDHEQFLIQAQKRMDTMVKATHFHTAGAYHLLVGGEKDGQLYGGMREKVFKEKHIHIKGEQRCWIEEDESRVVSKNQYLEITENRNTSVGGDDITLVGSNMQYDVTATAHIKAADVKVEATGTIELTAGGSSVVICSSGVYIVGQMVYINSGAGPTVPAVEGGMGPAAAEDAGGAESTQPGRDTRYSGQSASAADTPPTPDVPGFDFPEPPPPPPTTWIDIELKDQHGNPVPGEPYKVTDSAGRDHTGALDDNGFAHVEPVAPGMCEITFPRRDLSVWRRAGA